MKSSNLSSLPTHPMVLIALVQGLLLLLLHQAIELKFWPHEQPQWLFAFYSVVFIWPTILLLGMQSGRELAFAKLTLPFALICGLCGYYVGYQATPLAHIRYDSLLFAFVLTMAIATFKALMYAQQYQGADRISYSTLFKWSWRNFLTLSLTLLFAGCFWGILTLWGALFKTIGIVFFKELFESRWFYYPAIALANGFGVIIFRNLTSIIDTITRLQQALMKFLLVILTLISILFLLALPFTGLQPLWGSGGSTLILWMQALMLFFVNAVYQDEADRWPYSRGLHRFIYFGIALLPIYSAISFYGLGLRVEQYGWSLARCWAYLIWLLLALFPLGYCWGIFRLRDQWTHQLSRVNIAIGLIFLGCMLAVNSPLLDFRKITVDSQLARLESGKTTPDSFDFNYFRRNLARPGYLALQQLKEQHRESNPAVTTRIEALYADNNATKKTLTIEEFSKAIQVLGATPPASLLMEIHAKETESMWTIQNTQQYFLRSIDIDHDGNNEYLLVRKQNLHTTFAMYFMEDGQWTRANIQRSTLHPRSRSDSAFYEALTKGEMELERPRWDKLKVGDWEFQVTE